jgi:hypothetical protein
MLKNIFKKQSPNRRKFAKSGHPAVEANAKSYFTTLAPRDRTHQAFVSEK